MVILREVPRQERAPAKRDVRETDLAQNSPIRANWRPFQRIGKVAIEVYRLDGIAPTPVLLIRTPYDKEHPEVGTAFWRAVLAGYAVVIQDLRGWDLAAFCVGF